MKALLYFLFFQFSVFALQDNRLSQKYLDSISIEIGILKTDSLRASRYYNVACDAMERLNDLKLSRRFIDSAFHYSKKSKHKKLEAQCHFLYGILNRFLGNYQEALEHLDINIRHFKNDSTFRAYALFQVGVIHSELGDFENSLKTYLDILKIFEAKKDSFAMASTLNSIGVINGEMGQNDQAIGNLKKAVLIFEKLDQKRDISNTLTNIGRMYFVENEIDTSRAYIKKALAIARDVGEARTLAQALHAFGKIYLSNEPQRAFKYFKEAEALLEKNNFPEIKTTVFRDLGHYYKIQKKYQIAINYYEKALQVADTRNLLPFQKELNQCLSDIFLQLNEFDKAYTYQNQYVAYKDSILNKEKIKAISLLQIQFDTEKKEKAIIEQELKLNKQEEAFQRKQTQYAVMTGTAIFFLILGILVLLVFKQRQKRKSQEILTLKREYQIKTLEALIEGEEKERFRIAKELHDGVNGDLSAIKYKLSSLMEMNNLEIKEAIAMIDDSCKQVRAISHNLVPPSLERFNLVEATQVYCDNLNNAYPELNIIFQHLGDEVNMMKKVEINAYRIIQELVSNSIKHANASTINVQISCRKNIVQITVEDNGRGFNKDHSDSAGIGLDNVQSRVDYLKAEIDFVSNEKGTSYTIAIDKKLLNDY